MTTQRKPARTPARRAARRPDTHGPASADLWGSTEDCIALINSMGDAVLRSRDGVIVWCNDTVKEVFGYSKDELIGKETSIFVSEDIRTPELAQAVYAVAEKQGRFLGTTEARRKDGSKTLVEFSISRVAHKAPPEFITVVRDITRRQQREGERMRRAVDRSERYFRSLIENSQDAIIVVDREGKLRYESPSIERILGYAPGERTGEDVFGIVHPEDLPAAKEAFAEIIGNPGFPVRIQARAQHKDGTWRSLEVIASNLLDDPAMAGVVVNMRDITERKNAEEALRESEEKFRRFVEEMSDGYCVIQNGRVVFANAIVAEMFEYSTDEVIGKTIDTLLPAGIVDYLGKMHSRRRRGEIVPPQYETTLVGKDGNERPVEFGARLIEYAGRPAVSVVIRDIRERKLMERALRESEIQFRTVFDKAAIGMALIDMAGSPVEINPALQQMLGYRLEDLQSLGTGKYIHPDDAMLDADLFADLAAGRRDHYSIEKRTIRKDGAVISAHLNISLVRDADGNPQFIIAMVEDITERKEAEEALQRSEEHFRSLIENAHDVISIVHRDGSIEYESPSVKHLLGYTPEELSAFDSFHLVHPDDLSRAATLFEEVVDGSPGAVSRAEVRVLHRDGSWRHIEAVAKNMFHDPVIAGLVANFRDITERKQAEHLIRAQRDLSMSLGVARTLDDGVRACLEAALEVSGMDCGGVYLVDRATGALDLVFHEGLPPEFVAAASHYEADSPNTRLVMDGASVFTRYSDLGVSPTDTETDAELRAIAVTPVRDGEQVIGCLNVASRISDDVPVLARESLEVIATQIGSALGRLRASEALRASEEKLKLYLDNTPDAIFTVDLKSRFLYVNDATQRMLGYSREELIGKSFADLGIVPHEYLRKGMEILETSADRVPIGPNEFELIRKDGGRVSVEASGFPIEQEDRIEVIGIARDTTDRKRMEQQLQLTGRLAAVGELAAGVAHELNNPLASIQAYAQLLRERIDLEATAKDDIETIYGEAIRASKITGNLLSFAREHKPEKRLVSMNQIVRKSLELHAYRMKVSNIEVELDLDPDLPLTMADFHQLQQVFVNIVANAEQAMTDANGRGRLLIQTRKNGRFIEISFTDNGPGIPEKDLKRIFDPFFTTKDVGKGTGLGLSICYGIVQGHRGNMYARSTAGNGATFVVEMPIVPGDEPIEQRAFSSWSQGA